MYETFLENYINNLYNYQNQTKCLEQKNLFSKKDYYILLKPVIDLLQKYKDHPLEELRDILYQNSQLEEYLKDFFYTKEMAPGMVMCYETPKYSETIILGNKKEIIMTDKGDFVSKIEKMEENTIFDLASITKIFTSFSILLLEQRGLLSIYDEVIKYDPRFKNLKGITLFDLLTFQVPLKTTKRIDGVKSREEAEELLFSIEIDPFNDLKRPYTDMGAMILKYVIEKVSGVDYYSFLRDNILLPLQMEETYSKVPKEKEHRLASTNYDLKYYKDHISITKNPGGAVYDPKAQIMGQMEGNLSGHAGLFSTAKDMSHLANALLNEKIFSMKVLEKFSQNRTGRAYIEEGKAKYVQYFGMLCYAKYPHLYGTEVYHPLSGKTFASAGWTGTYFTVDPINQLSLFLGSNRSHNRVTFIDPSRVDERIKEENGKKMFPFEQGRKVDSSRFAFDRRAFVNPALALLLQNKMLEDFYKQFGEIEKKEKVKII